MLWNGLLQTGGKAGLGRRLPCDGREPVRAQRVAGERTHEVGAALAQPGVQRVRVGHLLLDEVLLVLVGRDVEAAARHEPAPLERVVLGVGEGHELVVLVELGEVEPARPAHGLERELARLLQPLGQAAQLPLGGRPPEASQAYVDRVHLAAADESDDRVARLLHTEAELDDLAVVAGHGHRALVSEEVRRVQHEHMQHVALDPLAAIDQAPQLADRAVDRDAAGVLDRGARAHLVGHGADAADARSDVGRLGVAPAAQQRLEEAGRLVDAELDLLHLAAPDANVHGSLALHAGQAVGLDGSRRGRFSVRGPRSPLGTGRRSH